MLQITLIIAFIGFIASTVCIASKAVNLALVRTNLNKNIIAPLVVFPIALSLMILTVAITPIYMPIVTLQNDKGQELVFIGMQHVGTKAYFEKVSDIVVSLRHQGYTVLHEGVGMNGNVTVSLKSCSKVTEKPSPTGLVSQPACIGELQPGDKYADLSQSAFLELYSNHLESLGNSKVDAKNKAASKSDDVRDEKDKLKSSYSSYIGLKIATLLKSIQYFTTHEWVTEDNFPVILDERNKVVANYISNEQKTVTAYGLAHMAGVKKLLLDKDPSWKIVSVDSINSL
tara:strand:- start:6132 stop:6989 length:858 start_codon:yes stop_codon:yes gene_type:complete